jgi:recombination protein RecR
MFSYPRAMRRLINELSKLPSIGEKSATRLAYHLVTAHNADSLNLAEAIKLAKTETILCRECFFLSANTLCEICSDHTRDATQICVVEKPADVVAIERSGGYRGRYHVLHGLWSPLRGISPGEIKIDELITRIVGNNQSNSSGTISVNEVVLATSTTVEGDATALYIANAVSKYGIKVSRIAQGIPKGGDVEYADDLTLSHAIEGRKNF